MNTKLFFILSIYIVIMLTVVGPFLTYLMNSY